MTQNIPTELAAKHRTVLFLLPRCEAFGLLSRRRSLEAAAQTISTECVHLPKESPPGCWAALRCRRAAGARAWPHRVSQLRVRDRLDSGLDHVLVAALRVVREADDATACAVGQTRERGNTSFNIRPFAGAGVVDQKPALRLGAKGLFAAFPLINGGLRGDGGAVLVAQGETSDGGEAIGGRGQVLSRVALGLRVGRATACRWLCPMAAMGRHRRRTARSTHGRRSLGSTMKA